LEWIKLESFNKQKERCKMGIININIEELQKHLQSISIEFPSLDALPTGNIENIREIVPKRPGIYAIFYADTGKCFYVGRAMDSIRKRLMMHYGKDKILLPIIFLPFICLYFIRMSLINSSHLETLVVL
jgi:hypothetical protein